MLQQLNPNPPRTFGQSAGCACAGSPPGKSAAGCALLSGTCVPAREHGPLIPRRWLGPALRAHHPEPRPAIREPLCLESYRHNTRAPAREARGHRAGCLPPCAQSPPSRRVRSSNFLFARSLPGVRQSPRMSTHENESVATWTGWYQQGLPAASSPSQRSRGPAALRASSATRLTLPPSACALRRGSPLCFSKPPARTSPSHAARGSGRCRGSKPRRSQSRPAKSPPQSLCTSRIRRTDSASALSRNSALLPGSSPRSFFPRPALPKKCTRAPRGHS